MCPGHDVTLHPSSATGNQQRPCVGPKPGQRRNVCQMGGDTLAVKVQDDRNPQKPRHKWHSGPVASRCHDVEQTCTGQSGQTDRGVGGESLGHIRVNATQVVLHAFFRLSDKTFRQDGPAASNVNGMEQTCWPDLLKLVHMTRDRRLDREWHRTPTGL